MNDILCAIFLAFCLTSFLSLRAPGAEPPLSIPVQLTHAENFDPSPSPDGKRLVFISLISGKEQLFTMDADGKNISQLTRDDADHEDPAGRRMGRRSRLFSLPRNGPASRS